MSNDGFEAMAIREIHAVPSEEKNKTPELVGDGQISTRRRTSSALKRLSCSGSGEWQRKTLYLARALCIILGKQKNPVMGVKHFLAT